MSTVKQHDGASNLGMGWISRFVNHVQAALPYKEGATTMVGCTVTSNALVLRAQFTACLHISWEQWLVVQECLAVENVWHQGP